jgi:hypothetical protein
MHLTPDQVRNNETVLYPIIYNLATMQLHEDQVVGLTTSQLHALAKADYGPGLVASPQRVGERGFCGGSNGMCLFGQDVTTGDSHVGVLGSHVLAFLGDLELSSFQIDNTMSQTLLRNLYDGGYTKQDF